MFLWQQIKINASSSPVRLSQSTLAFVLYARYVFQKSATILTTWKMEYLSIKHKKHHMLLLFAYEYDQLLFMEISDRKGKALKITRSPFSLSLNSEWSGSEVYCRENILSFSVLRSWIIYRKIGSNLYLPGSCAWKARNRNLQVEWLAIFSS